MSAPAQDTIAAVSTPPGRGGIGIVRVSGPDAPTLATTMLGRLPEPRVATFNAFRDADGVRIDDGLALYFPAPDSFTGEHVLELHGHGGLVIMDLILARVLSLGARIARPGEFTERAFLNGKLDLAQAEAVADLIDAASAAGARAASRSLSGEFSVLVNALVDGVTDLRVRVEAAIDFPEEEVDFLVDGEIERQAGSLCTQADALIALARNGRALRDGLTVVIAGPPNAGKSSLLNRLTGHDSAIVTDLPGTTRDLLREQVLIDGMPVHVVDTAGLRDTADIIEQEGVRRAENEIGRADRVLMVVDTRIPESELVALLNGLPARSGTLVRNKIDLSNEPSGLTDEAGIPCIRLSARTGAGLATLRTHLKAVAGMAEEREGTFSARRRHVDALERARMHIELGLSQMQDRRAGELMAEELRLAQLALGEITGAVSSDELLGRIFSSFCIGK